MEKNNQTNPSDSKAEKADSVENFCLQDLFERHLYEGDLEAGRSLSHMASLGKSPKAEILVNLTDQILSF
jgi:hypothetical protein